MITINEKTHMASNVDMMDGFEKETYLSNIDGYFEYLEEQAKEDGINIQFIDKAADNSYSYETEAEYNFMESGVVGFWQWHNC